MSVGTRRVNAAIIRKNSAMTANAIEFFTGICKMPFLIGRGNNYTWRSYRPLLAKSNGYRFSAQCTSNSLLKVLTHAFIHCSSHRKACRGQSVLNLGKGCITLAGQLVAHEGKQDVSLGLITVDQLLKFRCSQAQRINILTGL